MLQRDDRALQIAREMVMIPSVNTTEGERHIAEYLEKLLKDIPYFKNHPDQLVIRELKDDKLHRKNVMALIIGEKDLRKESETDSRKGSEIDLRADSEIDSRADSRIISRKETIILHGHTDTVGVEDFGGCKDAAFDPDLLVEKLKELDLPEDVSKDLESGDYMFGRGACDMKSGDAVFISLVERLSENVSKLSGNIILSLNPVEENLHTGVIEGLDVLLEWKEKYDLSYQLAINNDYTCPLYEGDKKITMYTGVVGKLLPCFYIRGRETHVGQCFEGIDASYIAARLVDRVHLNMDFSDVYDGEASMPPSVLKMKDLKPWYNVQTAKDSFVYFNYFVHNASIEEIAEKLVVAAEGALSDARSKVLRESLDYYGISKFCSELKSDNYKSSKFCDERTEDNCKASKIGRETENVNIEAIPKSADQENVYLYEALIDLVRNKLGLSHEEIRNKEIEITESEKEKGTDLREIPINIIRYFLGELVINDSVIVLYFAPPYCPHNMLQKECASLEDDLKTIAKSVGDKENLEYRFMHFFPSLSDSSYLKIDDSNESIEKLKRNFPVMDKLYPVPLEKIKRLNIPSVDFGCYGKDAHKWTERVHIPYTFEVLPYLLKETLIHFGYIE